MEDNHVWGGLLFTALANMMIPTPMSPLIRM